MAFQIKVDKLTVNNPKSAQQSYVHISSSDLGEESGLGQLFIIAEIRSREKKVPEILNQAIKELSEYYYHSPTKNTEAALETTCQYFNENISDIAQKPLKWIKEKTAILVAAIQDDKLTLASYGNLKVWLLRENKIHEIVGGKNADIKTNSKKILSQLISGQLIEDDVAFLTNATIFDYFSDENIKKTVSSLAPTQACAFFKNALLDFDPAADFSAIIIKLQPLKKGTVEIQDVSHAKLLSAEKNDDITVINRAEDGLASKIGQRIYHQVKGLAKNGLERAKTIGRKNKSSGSPIRPEDDGMETAGVEDNQAQAPLAADQGKKRLSFAKYRLALAVLIILALFLGSLFMISKNNQQNKLKEAFAKSVEQIKEKIGSSEAALIYKDEEKAQALLLEAKTMLNALPKQNAEEEYTRQELDSQIKEQIYKIFKLQKLSLDVELAAFPTGFGPSSNIFLSSKNILYLAQAGEIYKVNSTNSNLDKIADLGDGVTVKKIVAIDANFSVLYAGGNRAYIMDMRNNSTRAFSFNQADDQSSYVDLALYTGKAYMLDAGKNEILKFNYSSGAFGNPNNWLKSGQNTAGQTSIAVDGSVYLAARDGNVEKYFKGTKEVFGIKGAFEPISELTTIIASEELDKIYLLDRANNKILITDKQGRVQKQLISQDGVSIIGLAPANDEKNIYIMSESGIYAVAL